VVWLKISVPTVPVNDLAVLTSIASAMLWLCMVGGSQTWVFVINWTDEKWNRLPHQFNHNWQFISWFN